MNATIHIETAHFTLPAGISEQALINLERKLLEQGRVSPITATLESTCDAPQWVIGNLYPEHGGYFAGNLRGDDGKTFGLIVADCGPGKDIGRAEWGPNKEHDALSSWDGQANTQQLGKQHPAATAAAEFRQGALQDFYLPSRRELQLAVANVPHLFGTEQWYWSSTPYSDDCAWAVVFEYGFTFYLSRYSKFRVRPFRRFFY